MLLEENKSCKGEKKEKKTETRKKERKKKKKRKNYIVSTLNSPKTLSKHMLHQDLVVTSLKKMREEEKRKKTEVVSYVLVSFACISSCWHMIHASISL